MRLVSKAQLVKQMPTNTQNMALRIRISLETLNAKGIDSETRKTFHRALKGLHRAIEDMREDEISIRLDSRLSCEARTECLATTVLEKVQELSWVWLLLRDADLAHDRLYRRLFPEPAKARGNPVIAFLREQEIRSTHMRLPQCEIDSAYRHAITQGNDEVVRALTFALTGSLVSPAIREQIEKQQALSVNPEGFKKLEDLQLLRQELGLLADEIRQWLHSLGARPSNYRADGGSPVAA